MSDREAVGSAVFYKLWVGKPFAKPPTGLIPKDVRRLAVGESVNGTDD